MGHHSCDDVVDKAEALRAVAFFAVCTTLVFTAAGAALYFTASIPLSAHRVHNTSSQHGWLDSILPLPLLYKIIQWAGVALALLPYALDVLLLLFLTCLWCRSCFRRSKKPQTAAPPPPPSPALSPSRPRPLPNALWEGWRPGVHRAGWRRVREPPPEYSYVKEVVRMLSMEGREVDDEERLAMNGMPRDLQPKL